MVIAESVSLGCLQETMKDLCCEVEVIHTASFLKMLLGVMIITIPDPQLGVALLGLSKPTFLCKGR